MSYYFTQTLSPTRRNSFFEHFLSQENLYEGKQESQYKRMLLFDAIKKNHVVYIARKLHHNKQFLNDNVSGKTFLTEAVKHNRKKIVKILLFYSANPNTQDCHGKYPLHYAASNGNHEITKTLLRHHADPTVIDNKGNMPVCYLSSTESDFDELLSIYLITIQQHVKLTPEREALKDLIIQLALSNGCVLPLKLISESNNLEKENQTGERPVFVALQCTDRIKRNTMLNFLHIEGANFNTTNSNGDSLLHVACQMKNEDLAKDLLTLYNVTSNTENKNKDTPIHICAQNSCNKTMELIFCLSEDEKHIQQQNLQGCTPLHDAVINFNYTGVNILLNKLKSLTSNTAIDLLKRTNKNGDDVLSIACREQQHVTVKALLEIFIKEIRSFDNKQLRKELVALHKIIYKSFLDGNEEHLQEFITIIHSYNLDCYFLWEFLDDCELLKLYLDQGLSADTTDDQGNSIVQYAVENENINAVICLLQQRVELENLASALHTAVRKKNYKLIELLMKANNNEMTLHQDYLKATLLEALEQQSYQSIDMIIADNLNILLSFEPDPYMVFQYILSHENKTEEELKQSIQLMLNHYEGKIPQFNKIVSKMCVTAFQLGIKWLTKNFIQLNNSNSLFLLHEAVSGQKLDYIEHLLDNDITIDTKNKHGDTALHVAIRKKEIKKIYLLLEKGADVNCPNKKEKTCFDYAIHKGIAINLLPFLVQETYNRHQYNTLDGRKSQTDITGVLKNIVKVNKQDIDGNTCLHTAIMKQDHAISQLLVRSGADIFLRNINQETPLHLAIKSDDYELVYIMFQRLNSSVLKDMFIRLFLSILIKSKESSKERLPYLIQMLSVLKIDFNTPDRKGELALNTAVQYNRIDVVELLLDNNAIPNTSDQSNMSAIDYAVKQHNREILITLLLANENKAINQNDDNLFHLAVRYADMKLLEELLEVDSMINSILQSDINALNKQQKTPITIATELQNLNAFWQLLDNKADLSIRNSSGNPTTNLTTMGYALVRKMYFKLHQDDTFPANHLSEYECPVCLDIPEKVLSCSRGHVICSKCRQRLECPNCPICRVTLSIGCSRSLKHEQEIKHEMMKIIQATE